jgi:hypothetical protein
VLDVLCGSAAAQTASSKAAASADQASDAPEQAAAAAQNAADAAGTADEPTVARTANAEETDNFKKAFAVCHEEKYFMAQF